MLLHHAMPATPWSGKTDGRKESMKVLKVPIKFIRNIPRKKGIKIPDSVMVPCVVSTLLTSYTKYMPDV